MVLILFDVSTSVCLSAQEGVSALGIRSVSPAPLPEPTVEDQEEGGGRRSTGGSGRRSRRRRRSSGSSRWRWWEGAGHRSGQSTATPAAAATG